MIRLSTEMRGRVSILVVLMLVGGCNAGGSGSTSSTAVATTASTPRLFDAGEFAATLFASFFSGDDRAVLIVLIPEEAQAVLESSTFDLLSELEGYTYIGPEQVAVAANEFAQEQDFQPLAGSWVAYGLIPQFDDSAIDTWERVLGEIAGAVMARRSVAPTRIELPDGWTVLSELPFGVPSGALVTFSNQGVLVIDRTATRLIALDGSVAVAPGQPLPVTEYCCGGAQVYVTSDAVVGLAEGGVATWVLDLETMSWKEVDPRPSSAFTLGAASTEASFALLMAAQRHAAGMSEVAVLDLEFGKWTDIGPVPEPINVGGITTDGERLLVAGTHQGPNNNILGGANPVVYEYTETGGWTPLPDMPIHGQASTITWLDGFGMLGWNYDLQSALLDESGDWRSTGSVPMRPSECYPRSEAFPGGAIAFCGGLAWFDAATRDWHRISEPEGVASWYGAHESGVVGILRTARNRTLLIEYELVLP